MTVQNKPREITLEIVTVTPETAERMLRNQHNVRPIRPSKVQQYAAEMTAGSWHLTGEAIQFNGSKLLNGYHRLSACVLSGAPFVTAVARGIDENAVKSMDSGLKRTVGDAIKGDGRTRTEAVAATARILMMWERDLLHVHRGNVIVPRSAIVDYAEEHYDELLGAVLVGDKLRHIVGGSGAAYAAVYLKLDPDLRDEFFETVGTGENLGPGDARLALRNWLFNRSAGRVRVTQYFAVIQIIKAWNAWIGGRFTKALKMPPLGLAIPQIDKP